MKIINLALIMALLSVTSAHAAEDGQVKAVPAPVGAQEQNAPLKMRLDTDGDGFVTKDEFMKSQEDRFADMDSNKDGKISSDEMKASWDRWKSKRSEMRAKAMDKKAPPAAPLDSPVQ